MASDNEASCESDPNFAVICAFMEKFGGTCGLASIDFLELQEMLENTQEVPQELIDLHIKLLRKSRKTVSTERWEKAIIKICHGFCVQDAWEIERFGYKKARLSSKLRVLKELLEMQFDYNARFKAEINKMSAEELRSQPLGKDKQGHAYWFQNDSNCQIRVYKEDPDEETWTLVAKDREGLVSLISELSNGESKFGSESAINEEDSNSLAEKPIIDTGQVDSSSSDSNKKASSESENSNGESKKEENISSTPPEETARENEESEDEEKSESPPHLTAESELSTKRSRESDEDDEDAKKAKVEESQVGEAIEEPVMLVKGEGNGEDNRCVNRIEDDDPIVGEEIEEDLMYFYGCGNGYDCQTGNEDRDEKKSSSEKTGDGDDVSGDKSTNKDAGDSENYVSIRCSDSKNCVSEDATDGSSKEVPTSPVKSPFRLGTIIDTKTDNKFFNTIRSPTKKSRWDVETIIAKEPNCEPINDDEEREEAEATTPKKSMFFFGPGCLQFSPTVPSCSAATVAFGQKVPQTNLEEKFEEKKNDCCSNDGPVIPSNTKGDIGYRIEDNKEVVYKTIECVQSSEENEDASLVDHKTPIESRIDDKLDDRNAESEETKASHHRTDVEDEERKIEPTKIDDHDTKPDTEKKNEEMKQTVESKLKEEIVPENEIAATAIPAEEMQKLPQVTASLVECEEVEPKKEEQKEEQEEENASEEKAEPAPAVEEECIKKHAYVLGEETEDSKAKPEDLEETRVNSVGAKVERSNSVNETKTKDEETVANHEPEPALSVSVIKKAASEENVLNQKVEETKDNQQQSNCEAAKEEKEDVKTGKEKEERQTKGNANNANNKSVRGRKNNVPQDQSRIFTRRTTRSSKNEEIVPKTIEEKSKLTETNETSSVKEEKNSEKMKSEEGAAQMAAPPRRGRSRGVPKAGKEESVDGDGSKKMKMSGEIAEETETKTTRQTRNRVKENQEEKVEKKAEEKIEKEAEEKTEKKAEEKMEKKAEEKMEKKPEDKIDKKPEEKIEAKTEEKAEKEPEAEETKAPPESVTIESSNSSDLVELPDRDPLAVSEEETKKEEKPMSLATFSLDFNDSPTPTPPLTRSGLRKRGRESPPNYEEAEETAGKRLKKGKRNVDVKLRKSIEEQKKQELISSDEDKSEKKSAKKKGGKHKKEAKNDDAVVVSSDGEAPKEEKEPAQKKNKMNKTERLLSSLGIDPELALGLGEDTPVGVRQSRRIAQLKIKEEAERRKLEEEMGPETHKKKKKKKSDDKDYKVDKKRLKDGDDEEVQEDDSGDSKKKKKKKKKKHRKLFDEFNPWRSSSDSSSTDEEEDDEIPEESDDEVLQYVSDHEFSPESDMEGDGEALPLKRARTARKESDVEEVDDCPCQKCGKSDHPEWILLCDKCDNGWHCSCLRPPLLVIPEGDWFCPPCQHVKLLTKLQEKLEEYDKKLTKKELDDRRKQRLAYVGISLNSVLPTKESEAVRNRRRKSRDKDDEDAEADEEDDESSSDEESSESGSESASDSDEPIYQLRQRRQAHSYRFNDYDELINSAIQEEMEAVKGAGNQGRGKDISTIVNAEKEEEKKKEEGGEEQTLEPLPPVVPPDDRDKEAKPLYSDDEPVQGVRKKIIGRKKHRKLNSLDISSADDDADSDEDFKGTSSESDDDFDDDLGSEDSEDLDSGRNRRKNMDPVRRSTRARISRYDADFIDDGDTEDEDEAPKRKKKRSFWDDSESEESDRSWGRRKRKPASKQKKSTATNKKKKSKKKKKDDDSDAEVYRKKKPKIKFGLDGEDEGPGRRTRGKKINYVDALGSDSEEDRVKRPPPRIESEEEYVADEDLDEDDKATDEEDSGEENDPAKAPKVQIQSYADARFTQLLPEGVPTPKDLYMKNQLLEDGADEPNPIEQINRNVEMMDENEMEKMMEEEEYANKQLQLVALQLEKEKRRKEREAKKLEGLLPPQLPPQQLPPLDQGTPKKRGRKPKNQFQFSGPVQEPIVGNVDNLLVNSENNDELSEPPGVSLPLFAELGTSGETADDPAKKRRTRGKKSLEEAVASLGSVRQQESAAFMTMGNKGHPTDLSNQEGNIEIAAPPQPFSQSQPTPSVITRMLQSKPGQPGYPIGSIRPKQFASMPERDEDVAASHHSMAPAPAHHGQYLQGTALRPQLSSPYRQMPPNMNHYPRGAPPPPHQIRNPPPQTIPSHIYHSHRPMDPSPSGGGTISIPEHNSPGRVVSPAASSPGSNKNDTPPPPYSRPPVGGRFPPINTSAGPRHMHLVAPHLQPPRPNLSPYHPSMPPSYHYGQFGQPPMAEEAMPPTVYQNSPYSEQFPEGQVNQSENSNSKSFDEESGGEFGGLVSYFSSQREDDLES